MLSEIRKMKERIKREPYLKNKVKQYHDLKEFFEQEINYTIDKEGNYNHELPTIENPTSRVWIMFASEDKKLWDCVQVAQSKKEVLNEINEAIKFSFDYNYGTNVELGNSLFYENVCPKLTSEEKKQYRHYLYSKIGREYTYIKICLLDVDKYLGITQKTQDITTEAGRLIEICKNQYAEALIAYQTLSVYWNSYRSGVDGQLISYIAEHREEFVW